VRRGPHVATAPPLLSRANEANETRSLQGREAQALATSGVNIWMTRVTFGAS
jgi:hypothetical protein